MDIGPPPLQHYSFMMMAGEFLQTHHRTSREPIIAQLANKRQSSITVSLSSD
jgi:hypothetical protein